jgi:ABC-type transport system substrate-binding protein
MPSTYFEIKPQRAVSLSEFKGAIVPSDLPEKAKSLLEKAGIKDIYTYANADERKALTKKFGKEMFAGIPALPLAMPNDEVKAKTRQQQLEKQFNKKRVE